LADYHCYVIKFKSSSHFFFFLLQALDGFLLVVSCQDDDKEILYVSESVFSHLGLYMVDLVGQSLFTLVLEQDRVDVTESLALDTEDIYRQRSFFCQVRSAKGKRPNGRTKSPGQKLVHVSGQMREYQLETSAKQSLAFVGIVRVVKPVCTVEPRFSSCLLTCQTTIDMRVIEVNSLPLEQPVNCRDYWYPEDLPWILESYDKLVKFGQVVWMCHRILYYGEWIWVQAQSSVVKKKYIMTTVSLISDDVAKRALMVRGCIKENGESLTSKAHQPPIASTKPKSERLSPWPSGNRSRGEMSPSLASSTAPYMVACNSGSSPQDNPSQVTPCSRSSSSPLSHVHSPNNWGSPPHDNYLYPSESSPIAVAGSSHGSPPHSVQSPGSAQVHRPSSGPTYEDCGQGMSPYTPWIRSACSPSSVIPQNYGSPSQSVHPQVAPWISPADMGDTGGSPPQLSPCSHPPNSPTCTTNHYLSPPQSIQKPLSPCVHSQPRSPDGAVSTGGMSPLSISSVLPVFSPGEIDSLICDMYPTISTSRAESQILDGGLKISELWNTPSPEYPVTAVIDRAVTVGEGKSPPYSWITSRVSPPPRQLPIADCVVSPPCLVDWSQFTSQPAAFWNMQGFDLLPEVQDMKLRQYQSTSGDTNFTHQTETNAQLPLVSSDPFFLPPFHSVARGPPPDPVWTVRVPNNQRETVTLQESQVSEQDHSQAPPLTWDWAVGIDFNQGTEKVSGADTNP
jgi:hypothetical protein